MLLVKKKVWLFLSTSIAITLITLLSRVFGFFREVVLAYKLGVSEKSDAFILATTFPQIIYTSFILALGVNFIPLYVKMKEREADLFYRSVQKSLFLVSIVILFIFTILSKQIVGILSPGSSEKFIDIASGYSNISMISILFIGYINISVSKFNTKSLQIIGVTLPIITSLFTILSLSLYGLISLQISLLIISLSFFIQFLIIFFVLEKNEIYKLNRYKTSFLNKSNKNIKMKVKQLYKQSFPTMMSTYIDQLIPLFERFISSYLIIGSITYLNYSHRLNGLLVGVIGSLIMTLFFPMFSKMINESSSSKNLMISKGILNILIVCIPVTYFMYNNSLEIISVVYESGLFSNKDVIVTSSIFSIFVIGGLFNILRSFINSIFFSNLNTKDPFFASLIVIFIFITGVSFWRIFGDLNIVKVALIEVFSFVFAFLFLMYIAIKKSFYQPHTKIILSFIIFLNIMSLLINEISYLYILELSSFLQNEKIEILLVLTLKFIPYSCLIGIGFLIVKRVKILDKKRGL